MIINTTKSHARNVGRRAINKFRRAWKIPNPRITLVNSNEVIYSWNTLKYPVELYLYLDTQDCKIIAYHPAAKQHILIPAFPAPSDDEVVGYIIECLEFWFNENADKYI